MNKKAETRLRKLKKMLKRKPRMHGINGAFNFAFAEKVIGIQDAKKNQLCVYGNGHITPYINEKSYVFNSYIDRMYLETALNLEPLVTEATSLVVEFNLIRSKKAECISGDKENQQRQMASDAMTAMQNDKRACEILTKLAEIKAECNMIDESLTHHIERAEGIFHSRLSKYWKGVLSGSDEKLNYYPCLEERVSDGKKVYQDNSENLMNMINGVITRGGGIYEIN